VSPMMPLQNRKPTIDHSQIAKQPASAPVEMPAADAQSVAVRAYELWLARGCPDGSPEQDWYRAEQELSAGAESQPRAKRSPVAGPEPRSSGAAG
jgi:hypothetical protein